ncbi:hypothetical protein [Nocardia vinacea]|uniref:hypothetical protein n=1 Tax=Nocardia vinacea TaxID=96468 RepID=UPI000685CFE7|nr:hypothetical protein [Nocardia vinacea]
MFTKTSGGHGNTSVHHVYDFTARDSRVVRFEEQGGPDQARGRCRDRVLQFIAVVIGFCVGVMGYVPVGNL